MPERFGVPKPEEPTEPESVEIIEKDLLEARKYTDYLLNALYTRTTKDVAATPEYLAVLKRAKAMADEVNQLQAQIEALQAIAKRHGG